MSTSVNVHATGRFEPVTFRAEDITSSATGDLMLDIDTTYAGAQTADVTLFLSPTTARNLVACLAGHLGLLINEPVAWAVQPCPECGSVAWETPMSHCHECGHETEVPLAL